jgi:choline-sulfatase
MNFFEWSARVPLVFHAPKRFSPQQVDCNVSLVDLLPTLVELCGGEHYLNEARVSAVDGRSLLPLLQEDESSWPDTVLAELLAESAIAPCLMIRRDRYKYIYSEPDPEQLYDLVADPNELHNLAGQPEYEPLRQEFKAEIETRWEPKTLHQSVIDSQRRRRLVYQALTSGHQYTPWDFQPFRDASRRYMRNHLDLDDLERTARFPTPEIPKPDAGPG